MTTTDASRISEKRIPIPCCITRCACVTRSLAERLMRRASMLTFNVPIKAPKQRPTAASRRPADKSKAPDGNMVIVARAEKRRKITARSGFVNLPRVAN
jgi:hypothetical protein